MTDFTIPAAVIEKATDGAVDKKMLVNWSERGLWLTELQPPERGRPRLYSYGNALEACLAAAMSAVGFTRSDIKHAITFRGRDDRGVPSGWVVSDAEWLPELPEWRRETAYWAIIASGGTFAISAVANLDHLPDAFREADGLRIVNVGAVRQRLDKVLAEGVR